MRRSFDPEDMRAVILKYPDLNPADYDCESWMSNPLNCMFVSGDDVGLATYEYPGVYTVHCFFTSRGRQALRTAAVMLNEMFENHGAKVIRGITKEKLKGARWLNRQLGFESLGMMETTTGPHELFTLNQDDFKEGYEKWAA